MNASRIVSKYNVKLLNLKIFDRSLTKGKVLGNILKLDHYIVGSVSVVAMRGNACVEIH